jgi:hypothetical protein
MPGAARSAGIVGRITEMVVNKIAAHSGLPLDEAEGQTNETLSSYSEDALVLLERALLVADRANRAHLIRLIEMKDDPVRVHECAKFLPDLWSNQAMNSMESILSLHEYSQLPDVPNFALADEKTQQQCIALMNVTETIDGLHDFVKDTPMKWTGKDLLPVITDERLVDLVLENPDKARMITDFMAARQSVDYDALRELVNSGTPSLSSGLL